MWNDYANNPDNALDWQNRYMNFMFELEDSSGKAAQGRSAQLQNGYNLADCLAGF